MPVVSGFQTVKFKKTLVWLSLTTLKGKTDSTEFSLASHIISRLQKLGDKTDPDTFLQSIAFTTEVSYH